MSSDPEGENLHSIVTTAENASHTFPTPFSIHLTHQLSPGLTTQAYPSELKGLCGQNVCRQTEARQRDHKGIGGECLAAAASTIAYYSIGCIVLVHHERYGKV
ncbi:MAG: hypothetical protein ABR985_21790 [Methanotrichaceae archaeon]